MAPQDNFIEEDDDTCPLCIEELDIQDKNFHPCPCGYQVCQFCFNNIKNNMNGLCPACRRPYDEKTIQWKVVTQEEVAEFRAKIQKNQKRRAAEQRQMELQKREAEKDNRKNLVGVRVVQKNLVYVTGLTPTVREDELLKTLRKQEFFGQYGNIHKISISNRKSSDGQPQSLGIYVTFERKEDAARCIQAVNGSQNGDRVLRAQLGTTKYCSAWLRHETCSNRQCMFLHELGDEEDSYTRQDLSSMNSINTQRPLPSGASSSSRSASRQQSHPTAGSSSAMARSSSRDGSENGDSSALPSSANWARNPQVRSRRGSHATSGAAPSPAISNSLPVTAEAPQEAMEEVPTADSPPPPAQEQPSAGDAKPKRDPYQAMLHKLAKIICECSISLPVVSDADYPPLFDVRGGEKRRGLRDDEENPLGVETDLPEQVPEVPEGEPESSGSLALGGEPEDREPSRESHDFERRGSTQPPIRSPADMFGPSLTSSLGQASSSIAGSRAMTPQQQQQQQQQQAYLQGRAAFSDHGPPGIVPNQSALFQNPGHNRQSSRFSFANSNDNQSQSAAVKLAANPRIMAQQASMMPPTFPSQSGGQFYPSSVAGPPPGLKSTGTPPALFGHGFGGSGFGGAPKDTNEILQNMIRSGRGAGSQVHDAAKREYQFLSYPNQYPPSSTSSTPAPAPAANLLASFHGNQPGAFSDYGSKQKKKGKKHRHANTSSSGGSGLVDLVDPSILQTSRMQQHQQQSNAGVSPALYGGQSQDDDILSDYDVAAIDALVNDEPVVPSSSRAPSTSGVFGGFGRPATPAIPPGLGPLPAHLSPAVSHSSLQNVVIGRTQTPPIVPVTPLKPPPGVLGQKKAGAATAPTATVASPAPAASGSEAKKNIKALAVESGLAGDIASQASKSKVKTFLQEEDFPTLGTPKTVPATVATPGAQQKAQPVKSVPAASKRAEKKAEKAKAKAEAKAEKEAAKAEARAEKEAAKEKEKEAAKEKEKEKGKQKESDKAKELEKPKDKSAEKVTEKPADKTADKTVAEASTTPAKPAAKVSDKRPIPGILNIAAATKVSQIKPVESPKTAEKSASDKSATTKDSAFPALPTPSTASVLSPVTRAAPKTLRVVSTPRTEVPSMTLPAPVRSAATNVVRPETPGSEIISDTTSVVSAGVSLSRTSSPPPSRVGTAPLRTATKSQQRKARKEAVKKDAEAIATPKPEPEVEIAPIVGRKKKQKKEKTNTTASSNATPTESRPETPVTKESTPAPVKEVKETKDVKDDSSAYRSTAHETMSLTDARPPVRVDIKGKARDASDPGSAGGSSLDRSAVQLTPSTTFAELYEEGALPGNLASLSFLKPVSGINDKHSNSALAKDLMAKDDLLERDLLAPQTKSIVDEEDHAALVTGQAVRKLVDGLRVMLTPYGDCVRNLTPEEEDHFLELQERVAAAANTPAAFVSARHEPASGFSLIKGRAVPNGAPTYFPSAPGAYPQDPTNKIQREEAIYYINQYVLPRINLGTTGFPGAWKSAGLPGNNNNAAPGLTDKMLSAGLNYASAAGTSAASPEFNTYLDTAAPELSYPAPSASSSDSHQQNVASLLVNHLAAAGGPWLGATSTSTGVAAAGGRYSGATASAGGFGGPWGQVPLMSLEDAEHALQAARKETEKLEKTLNQVIKKNRKMLGGGGGVGQQQGISAH